MAVTLKQARTLCTASELELVRASMGSKPQSSTPARLRQKVTRARRLRGKFRDVGDRQRRESRGKQAARGARPASGNLGTRLKEQLFAETLERFEQALQAAESRDATQTAGGRSTKKKTSRKTPTTKTPTTAATKKTASKASGKKAASKKAAKKTTKKAGKKKLTKSGGRKASAKLSAAGTTTSISAARKKTRKASSTLPARKKSAKKTTKKSKKKAARRTQTAKKKRLTTKDLAAEGPRKARRFARSGQTRTQGHVSGRNRRNQARRDS